MSCFVLVGNTGNLRKMHSARGDMRKSSTGKRDDDIYSCWEQKFRGERLTALHSSPCLDFIEDEGENSKICSIISFSTIVYISTYSLLCMWNHPSLLLHFITYDLMLYPKQFRKFHFNWSLVKRKIQRGHSFSFFF